MVHPWSSLEYVGVLFISTTPSIFYEHYSAKAKKARKVVNTTFAVKAMDGHILLFEARILCLARVDPHSIFDCEVSLDVDPSLLTLLKMSRSRTADVFSGSEPGVYFPPCSLRQISCQLRCRCLLQALSYLNYLASLLLNYYVSAALRDSIDLAAHD